MNRRSLRFSLASLLTAIALMAIALTYARVRREGTIAEYQSLYEEGVGLVMETGEAPAWANALLDEEFWLRRPVAAELYLVRVGPDFEVGGRRLGWAEAQAYLQSLKSRLEGLGVSTTEVWLTQSQLLEVDGASESQREWADPGEVASLIAKLGMTQRLAFGASDLQLRHKAARP